MAEDECKVSPNKSAEFTEKTAKITKKRQEDVGKPKGKGIDEPTDELEDLLDYPEWYVKSYNNGTDTSLGNVKAHTFLKIIFVRVFDHLLIEISSTEKLSRLFRAFLVVCLNTGSLLDLLLPIARSACTQTLTHSLHRRRSRNPMNRRLNPSCNESTRSVLHSRFVC